MPSPFALDPTTDSQARFMASALRSAPESRLRCTHTERLWSYRAYEGSDPANAIDWKQSGRTQILFVREHEKIITRNIFFFADLPADLEAEKIRQIQLVLLALGYTLVEKALQIGWLNPLVAPTQTASFVAPLVQEGLATSANLPLNINGQLVILITDGTQTKSETLDLLRTYLGQGNHGLIFQTSPLGADAPLVSLARSAAVPVIELTDPTRLDLCLGRLLENIMVYVR